MDFADFENDGVKKDQKPSFIALKIFLQPYLKQLIIAVIHLKKAVRGHVKGAQIL